MNSAGELAVSPWISSISKAFFLFYLIFSALSLAASMFETNNTDGESLADTECQLYVLGIKYKTPHGKILFLKLHSIIENIWFTQDTYTILDDVASRYWFTYRTGFAPIGEFEYNSRKSFFFLSNSFLRSAGPSGPTKDTGWGCMMRCGQMMLAEAYLRFFIPNGRRKLSFIKLWKNVYNECFWTKIFDGGQISVSEVTGMF